jgi:hypothetical protein
MSKAEAPTDTVDEADDHLQKAINISPARAKSRLIHPDGGVLSMNPMTWRTATPHPDPKRKEDARQIR